MSNADEPAPGRPRKVTPEEVAFYRKNGWVHLKGLLQASTVEQLLAEIQRLASKRAAGASNVTHNTMWENISTPARDSELLRTFAWSPQMGSLAADLEGRSVKYWRDEVVRKMPTSHPASGETPWHQDQPYTPADRGGRVAIWIALVDIPPERGSLRFLTGSHRAGLLGRAFGDKSDAMKRRIAALMDEFPTSPPLHLRAGDATAHEGMTIHAAFPNSTEQPRWVYVPQYIAADARYTGAWSATTDGCPGLEMDKPFPDEWFPTLA